jgi:hypothetical protein
MLQRIQSVYLLIAVLLIGTLFFLNMAELSSASELYSLTYKGVINQLTDEVTVAALALSILLVVTTVLLVIAIFLYKKRILQIRVCGLNIGLLLGLSVMIYFFGKTSASQLGAEIFFNWPLVLPLISLVLVFLAIRGIGRDEALVRSLDRIR